MGEDADQVVLVPVRLGRCGSVAVRTGRLESGERVGLAFTSEAALGAVFGAGQAWVPMNVRVAREMFGAAGAERMRVDAVAVPVAVPVPVPVVPVNPVPVAVPASPARKLRLRPLRPQHHRLMARHGH